ncbi:ATP-binding cassette sub-family A member 13-like [Rhinolophus sinicus]|uniref:ATP-binding cassette sub-family A member 13-like n=1 Tax=Rhinolophus sinicus TaxID=89399 RepID=UPI003D7A1BFC
MPLLMTQEARGAEGMCPQSPLTMELPAPMARAHFQSCVGRFPNAPLSSLTSLEDSDWLPLNPTFSRVSEIVLNVTISALTFLQEHGVAGTGSGCSPQPLHRMLWDPQQVRADLESRFGLDDFHAQQILSYPVELMEIPTPSSLERILCSVLYETSEDEGDREGHPGDCHPRWSAAQTYLVQAVSWLHVYKQVFCQWWKGSPLQDVLAGAGRSLQELSSRLEEGSLPRTVVAALHAGLSLLNDSMAADGPTGSPPSPKMIFHMLEKAQLSLEQMHYWKALTGLIRKTCEVARYVNMPEGFQNSPPVSTPLATSRGSAFAAGDKSRAPTWDALHVA